MPGTLPYELTQQEKPQVSHKASIDQAKQLFSTNLQKAKNLTNLYKSLIQSIRAFQKDYKSTKSETEKLQKVIKDLNSKKKFLNKIQKSYVNQRLKKLTEKSKSYSVEILELKNSVKEGYKEGAVLIKEFAKEFKELAIKCTGVCQEFKEILLISGMAIFKLMCKLNKYDLFGDDLESAGNDVSELWEKVEKAQENNSMLFNHAAELPFCL